MLGFKWVVLAIITLCVAVSGRLHAVPGTDISLFRILNDGTTLSLVFEKTLVQRKGYDNQPAFTDDSSAVVYTRMDQGTTDIWWAPLPIKDALNNEPNHNDINGDELVNTDWSPRAITQTAASEYSATPGFFRAYAHAKSDDEQASTKRINGANDSSKAISFSAVVASDEQQTLWRYHHDKPVEQLSGPVEPVGYHAWVNKDQLAMFRLANPHELVLYKLGNDKHELLAKDIGRCLVSKNNGDEFFFVQNQERSKAIYTYSLQQRKASKVITLLEGSEDFAYHPEIGLIHSNGARLFFSLAPFEQWSSLPTNSDIKLFNISRLAISPNAKWLAVVHQDLK